MSAIVKFPTVIEEALERFGAMFPNQPERKHFAEYLTGLMIAHKKNVSAINREFAMTTDQFCLNRWITHADGDEETFNQQRLDWLQESPDKEEEKTADEIGHCPRCGREIMMVEG